MGGAEASAHSSIFSAVVDFAAAFPLLSVVGVLAVLWAAAQLTATQRSGSPVGGEASKDEALARARQIQQERMERAAAARAATAEGPARIALASAAGPSTTARPSHPAKQPAAPPAKPAAVARSADDPNSVSARLAKIEKGKGPSEHNPLQGFGGSSSSAASVVCRRKGG
jgi:hypothetical protein